MKTAKPVRDDATAMMVLSWRVNSTLISVLDMIDDDDFPEETKSLKQHLKAAAERYDLSIWGKIF